jgi:hypothetical protein
MDTVTRTAFLAKPEVNDAVIELRRAVRTILPQGSFAEREEAALVVLEEAMRSTLEEELRAIADGFGQLLLVDGVEHKRHQPGVGKYHCLGGALHVARDTYRQVGVHNGPTVVPLELVAGLAEGATPALGYNIIHGYAQRDTRQHGESLAAAHRTPPPRATLERMAKRLAKRAHQSAPRIEAVLRQTETLAVGFLGAQATTAKLPRTAAYSVKRGLKRTGPERGCSRTTVFMLSNTSAVVTPPKNASARSMQRRNEPIF